MIDVIHRRRLQIMANARSGTELEMGILGSIHSMKAMATLLLLQVCTSSGKALTRSGKINISKDNRTYSIDLTSSWTNKTVSINSIYKAAQIYNDAALWPDASGRSFYSYDGGYSFSIPVVNRTTNGLARFTPDGSSGSWSLVSNPASSNFSSLTRVMGASYGYGNGLGFALGGRETTGTNSLLAPMAVLAPGLVIYDSSSNNWFNLSSTGYSSTGFASRGSLQFLPQFGTKGLLLSVGGDANVPDEYVPLVSIQRQYRVVGQCQTT